MGKCCVDSNEYDGVSRSFSSFPLLFANVQGDAKGPTHFSKFMYQVPLLGTAPLMSNPLPPLKGSEGVVIEPLW